MGKMFGSTDSGDFGNAANMNGDVATMDTGTGTGRKPFNWKTATRGMGAGLQRAAQFGPDDQRPQYAPVQFNVPNPQLDPSLTDPIEEERRRRAMFGY